MAQTVPPKQPDRPPEPQAAPLPASTPGARAASSRATARRGHHGTNWPVLGIFLILAFGFVAEARAFLMPATLAMLLFFVFVPFRRMMARIGVGPAWSAGIVSLGLVLATLSLGYSLAGPIGSLIANSDRIGAQVEDRYAEIRERFRGLEQAAAKIDQLAQGGETGGDAGQAPAGSAPADPVSAPQRTPAPTTSATATVTNTPPGAPPQSVEVTVDSNPGPSAIQRMLTLGPEIISQIVFTLVLLYFLLASGDLMYLKIVQSFDSITDKRAAYLTLREIEDSLGRYLGSITLINVGLGVAIGLAMWAWGMPAPLLWAVAGFVLNYIPYIGAMAGTIGGVIVALLVFDDMTRPLLVGLTFLALTSLEGQFVTPQFVSRRLQLNEVVVFLTVALWAWLWSVLGMVVAVPTLVVLRVLCDHIPRLEKFGNFLAGEAPPQFEDETEDEAREIVEAGEDAPEPQQAVVATAEVVVERVLADADASADRDPDLDPALQAVSSARPAQ